MTKKNKNEKFWGNSEVLDVLFELNKPLKWVEIGVWRGDTAHYILNNLNIEKMYLIDPYGVIPVEYSSLDEKQLNNHFGDQPHIDGDKKFAYNRIKDFESKCVWLNDYSENVHTQIPNNSIDVVYIDGNHSYKSVLLDLTLYNPKLKIGGIIICDDYIEEGVKKAVIKYTKDNGINFNVSRIRSKEPKLGHKAWWIKS